MNFYRLAFDGFVLKIYGIGTTIAFLVFSWLLYKALQKKKMDTDFFVHHYWKWLLSGGLIGRIVGFILYSLEINTFDIWNLLTFWNGGVHIWSFILGFVLFAYWDLKKHAQPALKWLDTTVKPYLYAVMITNIFGFITGVVHGTETSLPWGIRYETFGVNILTPVHPVTIYALIIHWIILRWVSRHEKPYAKKPGKLFTYSAIPFLVIEFFLHFLRADHSIMVLEIFRFDQIILFGLTLWVTLYMLKMKKETKA